MENAEARASKAAGRSSEERWRASWGRPGRVLVGDAGGARMGSGVLLLLHRACSVWDLWEVFDVWLAQGNALGEYVGMAWCMVVCCVHKAGVSE